MSNHTIKAFDAELKELSRKISDMGAIVEKQIGDAMSALFGRDQGAAQAAIAADKRVDVMQHEIEEQAILTIARRQPMAVDLREIVSTLRIAGALERIGDYAKNIGKRAIAAGPRIVLMDEPFGALDQLTRDALGEEYRKLHNALGLTTIMITHDMGEALLFADRIAVMHGGRIVAEGTPRALMNDAQAPDVRELLATPRRHAERLYSLMARQGDG